MLYVVPPVWNALPGGMPPLPGLDAPEHELRARIDQALDQEFVGLLKIVEFAHNKDVDLIMMPTHGVSGYRNMLLGSVTVKVLHEAKCPVWTATHAEE